MLSLSLVLSLSLLSPLVFSASAANCNGAQPRREGDPSGQEISDALRGSNDGLLDNVCNGGFPPGSNTISTFNTGSVIYNVTRADENQQLQHCKDAFINIIEQCITGDNFWGGYWELDGETYAIYDQSWPEHTLPADLIASATQATPTSTVDTSLPAGATVITSIIDGSPITATFVPTTLTEYTQPTTTTTSIDGVIVPLIVGAGGVAWIPFIPVGGAPPPAITPPGIPGIPGAPGTGGDGGDGDGGDDGNEPPTTTSSTASSTSSPPARFTPDDIYIAANACGTDPNAATRTTTFSKSSPTTTRPAAQTVTSGCNVCILPYGSNDPSCTQIPGCVSTPPDAVPSTTTEATPNATPTAVFPTAAGVKCGSDATGGARLSDCLALLGTVASGDRICTSDQGRCQSSGESVGGDPLVTTSSFCRIALNSGCAFVVANKLSTFGFPGSSCFTGADIDLFIKTAANQCNNGNMAYAIAQGPSQFDSFCLVSQDNPGICGA